MPPPRPTSLGSFAERGVIIPFQAPGLLATRARADSNRSGIAAILPNFSGTGTQFVLPWHDIATTFSLNQADHALHRAIAQDYAITPEQVEAAVRRVAEMGAAGPAAQQEVLRVRQLEQDREVQLQTILLVYLAQMNAVPSLDRMDVERALGQLRRRYPPRAHDSIVDRARVLAQELLPIGLPECRELRLAGRVRAMLGDIAHMRSHLARRAWNMPELIELVVRFDRSGNDTLRVARQSLNVIDRWLLDITRNMQSWPNSLIPLRQEVRRLTWLLDGWEQAIACYAVCVAEWFTPGRDRQLARLMTLAPVIPPSEVKAIPTLEAPSAFGLGERLLEARRAALRLLEVERR
jgi:hypothetical protein